MPCLPDCCLPARLPTCLPASIQWLQLANASAIRHEVEAGRCRQHAASGWGQAAAAGSPDHHSVEGGLIVTVGGRQMAWQPTAAAMLAPLGPGLPFWPAGSCKPSKGSPPAPTHAGPAAPPLVTARTAAAVGLLLLSRLRCPCAHSRSRFQGERRRSGGGAAAGAAVAAGAKGHQAAAALVLAAIMGRSSVGSSLFGCPGPLPDCCPAKRSQGAS